MFQSQVAAATTGNTATKTTGRGPLGVRRVFKPNEATEAPSETLASNAALDPIAPAVVDRSLPGVGRIFKLNEAAEILRISRSELYRIMDSGRLKTIGAHKARRVLESDLVDYVKSMSNGNSTKAA